MVSMKRAAERLAVIGLLGVLSTAATANELLVGRFASETREYFGRDTFGELEIEVVLKGEKYTLSFFQSGKLLFTGEAVPCDPAREGYLRDRPPGEAYALCGPTSPMPVFVYSQNGIRDPMARLYTEKGLQNPKKNPFYRARYYAHVRWGFYGFRKIRGAAVDGPNLKCSEAPTKPARLICSDAHLSKLDQQAAALYKQTLEKSPAPAAVMNEQKQWFELRDRCDDAACIAKVYEERIAALRSGK
jgi:hypothetical protein